jgi:hypothetical protein
MTVGEAVQAYRGREGRRWRWRWRKERWLWCLTGAHESQTTFYLRASRRGAIYRIFTATRSSFLGRFCRPDSVKQCMWTGPRIKRMAHHYSVPYLNTFLKACLARWSSDCRNIKSETPNLELFVWDYSHFGTFSLYSLQEIHSILNTGVSCAWRKKKRRKKKKKKKFYSGKWGLGNMPSLFTCTSK